MDATILYLPNECPPLKTLTESPQDLLKKSLTKLVKSYPPEDVAKTTRMGIYQGPTSVAYLFFHLSRTHSQWRIEGKSPMEWFRDYIACTQEPQADVNNRGISSEYLWWLALNAIIKQDAGRLIGVIESVDLGEVQEVLLGNAGFLVLLRFVREFIPGHEEIINTKIRSVTDHISKSSWLYHGREFTGAVHGNIGIITQLALSGAASKAEDRLYAFLDLQQEDGNWYSTTDRKHEHMQWCHGVAGCVISLLTIKRYFPSLSSTIDFAVERARALIFEKGLIKKEPCLCHGVTGNALALAEDQRNHLLTFATPHGISSLEWESSTDLSGLYCGEAGRAWVWAMLDGGRQGFPGYTDV